MENINIMFLEYLQQHSISENDMNHSMYIYDLFVKQSSIVDNELIIDCHQYRLYDIYWVLQFIVDKKISGCKIIFITGVGNHSKKPQMDYFESLHWKNPLYVFVVDFFTKLHLGGRIKCEYGKIIYNPKSIP